jgi:hypothetical protein
MAHLSHKFLLAEESSAKQSEEADGGKTAQAQGNAQVQAAGDQWPRAQTQPLSKQEKLLFERRLRQLEKRHRKQREQKLQREQLVSQLVGTVTGSDGLAPGLAQVVPVIKPKKRIKGKPALAAQKDRSGWSRLVSSFL